MSASPGGSSSPSKPPPPPSAPNAPTGPPSKPKQRSSSSSIRPLAPNTLMKDIRDLHHQPHQPVEPEVLADAISKLDTLRSVKTPSASASAATSPSASGASSPNALGLPGVERVMPMASVSGGIGIGTGGGGTQMATSPPGAGPYFGRKVSVGETAGAGTTGATATGGTVAGNIPAPADSRTISAPGTPHFGAQTDLLKTLDDTTKVIRQSSKAPQRAPSVSGIGTVVEKPDYSEAKIVVAMVGLPARGKSYLSNKLMRYLRWLEYNVEVFNVGQLRRSKAREEEEQGAGKVDHSADYFSSSNAAASQVREKLATESLETLISWLKTGEGNVGIMDATNSTFDRREKIRHRIAQEPGLQLLFLESFCNDPAVIAANIALKARSGDPDYAGMSQQEAEADFRKRIEQYERVYQTITEPNIAFCRILNVGQQVTINRIEGYLQSRIAFYLMNLHLKPRSIYLSRHGESMYNVEGKIGGDSDLSPRGWEYAKALPDLVKKNIGDLPLEVWTSTLQRTIQTGSMLPFEKKTWKSLDELDAGVCDGMTYEEIEQKYPEDYESRDEDKFNYRYRGGESYRDVVVRLEPVIMELERQENILIIGHQAILRCLYAYFMSLSQEELPYIKIPLHTLIKITPMAYGCHEERYHLPIAAVDTHRPKPKKGKAPDGGNAPDDSADMTNRSSTARDYFGNTIPVPQSTKGGGDGGLVVPAVPPPIGGAGVTPSGVKAALEKVVEAGEMTPKAAAVP